MGEESRHVGAQRLGGLGYVAWESWAKRHGGLARGPTLRIHHLVQGPFDLGLAPRGELVQHGGNPVHPAARLPGLGPDLADRGPSA